MFNETDKQQQRVLSTVELFLPQIIKKNNTP